MQSVPLARMRQRSEPVLLGSKPSIGIDGRYHPLIKWTPTSAACAIAVMPMTSSSA